MRHDEHSSVNVIAGFIRQAEKTDDRLCSMQSTEPAPPRRFHGRPELQAQDILGDVVYVDGSLSTTDGQANGGDARRFIEGRSEYTGGRSDGCVLAEYCEGRMFVRRQRLKQVRRPGS